MIFLLHVESFSAACAEADEIRLNSNYNLAEKREYDEKSQ